MPRILIDHLTQAVSFYRGQLRAAHRAVAYLEARDLRGDITTRYSLDYAPAGFQVLHGTSPNYNDQALKRIGLVAVNDGGRRYDRFRGWIMLPILDDAGSAIGFGGRVLGGDGSKCLNSPETEVFQEGRVLFSLTQAAEAIAMTDAAYAVEGYLDVINLVQHDVQNAVAALGMATTGQHVEWLLSLIKRVIPYFDGSDAGRRAVVCILDVCLPYVTGTADVSFLLLPRGHNPSSYVRAKGGDVFNDLALEASSLEDFSLASTMQSCQLEYAEDRVRLVAAAAPHLRQINIPTMLCRILTAIAGPSKLSVDELIDLCGLEEGMLSTINRQQPHSRTQLIDSEWTINEPRKQP